MDDFNFMPISGECSDRTTENIITPYKFESHRSEVKVRLCNTVNQRTVVTSGMSGIYKESEHELYFTHENIPTMMKDIHMHRKDIMQESVKYGITGYDNFISANLHNFIKKGKLLGRQIVSGYTSQHSKDFVFDCINIDTMRDMLPMVIPKHKSPIYALVRIKRSMLSHPSVSDKCYHVNLSDVSLPYKASKVCTKADSITEVALINTRENMLFIDSLSALSPMEFGDRSEYVSRLFYRMNKEVVKCEDIKDELIHMMSIYKVADTEIDRILMYNSKIVEITLLKDNEFPLYDRNGNVAMYYENTYDAETEKFNINITREVMPLIKGRSSSYVEFHTGEKFKITKDGLPIKIDLKDTYFGYQPLFKFDIILGLKCTSDRMNKSSYLKVLFNQKTDMIGYIKRLDSWFIIHDGRNEDSARAVLNQRFIVDSDDKRGVVGVIKDDIDVETDVAFLDSSLSNDKFKVLKKRFDTSIYITGIGTFTSKVRIETIDKLLESQFKSTLSIRYESYEDDEYDKSIVDTFTNKFKDNALIRLLLDNNVKFTTKTLSEDSFDAIVEKYGVLAFKAGMISKIDTCEYGDIYYATLPECRCVYVIQLRSEYAKLMGCKAVEYECRHELVNLVDSLDAMDKIPSITIDIPAYDTSFVIAKTAKRIASGIDKLDVVEFVESQEEFNIYFSDSKEVGNCSHGTIDFGLKLLQSPNLNTHRYQDLPVDDEKLIMDMCENRIIYCNKDEVLAGLKLNNIAFKTTVANKMLQIKNKGEK